MYGTIAIVGILSALPGIGMARISYHARWARNSDFLLTVALSVLCCWVLSEATSTYFIRDFNNVLLSVAGYLAVCVLGAQAHRIKGRLTGRLAFIAIFTVIIFGPAGLVTRSFLTSVDDYSAHKIEGMSGDLTCYVNYWGEPMSKQGQRLVLRRTFQMAPFLETKAATVIVESSGFSEGFFSCQDALAAYRNGETNKYIVH